MNNLKEYFVFFYNISVIQNIIRVLIYGWYGIKPYLIAKVIYLFLKYRKKI